MSRQDRSDMGSADTALPVSVIITFYRSDNTFVETLASVLAQSQSPAEIIVVDDCSPAGMAESLNQLPSSVQLVRLTKNTGVGGARDAGRAAATSEYLAYLDADDRWPPDYLEQMVGALERNPNIPATYAAIARCWPDGRREVFADKPAKLDLREAIVRSHLIPSGWVIRSSALDGVGGWLSDRATIEDWHLSIRMIERFGPIVFVPDVAIDYSVGNPGSINSRDANVLRNWWRSLRQLKPIVDGEFGQGASRRRFAKALADRADRRRGVSRRLLHLAARLMGPPLEVL